MKEHLASRKMPMSAVPRSPKNYTEDRGTGASLNRHKLCMQNTDPGMEESALSVCVLYAKLVKVLMTHAQWQLS